MKTKKNLCTAVLFFISLSLSIPSVCHAAANALDGTRWEFTLSTSINVASVGKVVAVTNPVIEFSNGNEFQILDENDIPVLSGDYSIDAKGKVVLNPDTAELQEFLYGLIWDVLDSNPLDDTIQVDFDPDDINITKGAFTALLKSKTGLQTLTVKGNGKAKVAAQITDDVGTETVSANVSLVIAGVAYQDLNAYDASSWDFPAAKEKVSVSGFGSLNNITPMTLTLEAKPAGPADTLPSFTLSDNQGTSFTGNYLRNKNKLTFFFDTVAMEQIMENAIIQQIQQQYGISLDDEDIWIDVTKIKSAGSIKAATPKKEASISFSLQATFVCYVMINDELIALKTSYALTGAGTIQ